MTEEDQARNGRLARLIGWVPYPHPSPYRPAKEQWALYDEDGSPLEVWYGPLDFTDEAGAMMHLIAWLVRNGVPFWMGVERVTDGSLRTRASVGGWAARGGEAKDGWAASGLARALAMAADRWATEEGKYA